MSDRDRDLALGRSKAPSGEATAYALPPHHLVTHGVVLGMTGSGKTGLTIVLIEEALRSGVPVVLVDVKGDLANLLLTFPTLAAEDFEPYVDEDAARRTGKSAADVAAGLAQRQREGLAGWGLGPEDVARLRAGARLRVVTPGARHGEPLDLLSALSARSRLWGVDDEAALDQLSSGISLVLRLAGRDGDPQSRDHVVLTTLALRRVQRGEAAPLEALLRDVLAPPVDRIGVMAFEEFLPPKEQQALAQALNSLFASPRLAAWQTGAPLDVGAWLRPEPVQDGVAPRTPGVIVSVAHLDDEERQLVLGLLFDEILAYVRGLSGTSSLRALVVFDEVYGFLPPHPHNPPTKRPLLALLKQARAFGVGVLLATQNPMDLDYKALSNAGLWAVGRLQTDADRERVTEALAGSAGGFGELSREALTTLLKGLPGRHFVVRDAHASPSVAVVESRWAMSWLRGPLTRAEITRLVPRPAPAASAQPAPSAGAPAADAALVAAQAAAVRGAAPIGAQAPAAEGPPPAPAGWSSCHGHARPGAARWVPFVTATVAVHLRDAELALALERRVTVIVPFDAAGRPDTSRTAAIDPALLSGVPQPGLAYAPLPDGLRTKKGAQAIERQIKSAVTSALPISLDVQRELGLFRQDAETREAFGARCVAVATQRAALAEQACMAEHAPALARLAARREAALRELAAAQAESASAPSDIGAALVSVALGRGAGNKLASAGRRAGAQLAKAQEALAKIDADIQAELSERDTAIYRVRAEPQRAAAAIASERYVPKKGDVEVVSIGLAWSPEP